MAGTLSGILITILTKSILKAHAYLLEITVNENQIIIGTLLFLIMVFLFSIIPVVLFPLLNIKNGK